MHRRILVPVDGSDTAARGLDEAIVLAKAFDARLVLLSVVESFPVMMELSSATSWEGNNDTSALDKTITATVSAMFALQ